MYFISYIYCNIVWADQRFNTAICAIKCQEVVMYIDLWLSSS